MRQLQTSHNEEPGRHTGHSGHGWMMVACCIPLLVIAVVLVATGVATASFLFAAIACMAMMGLTMAMMIRGMAGGGK
jgi:hypothetical protein